MIIEVPIVPYKIQFHLNRIIIFNSLILGSQLTAKIKFLREHLMTKNANNQNNIEDISNQPEEKSGFLRMVS